VINTTVFYHARKFMPQLCQDEFPEDDADLQAQAAERQDAQRDRLRISIEEIATDVTATLRDADLTTPVFLAVPSSGSALLSFATSADPTNETWEHVSKIVCQIVGNTIGVTGLIGRSLTVPSALAPFGSFRLRLV
jgi:hypothetical protein